MSLNILFTPEPKQKISFILRVRLPWLILGLLGGLLASMVVSSFEEIIAQNISLVFFVPLIVYISDAIGTQTETIFVRDLATSKLNFLRYLIKETLVGALLGVTLGSLIAAATYLWLNTASIAIIVGASLAINATFAPVVALLVSEVIFKEKSDPAIGAGPFATVIQDVISVFIYFLIASWLL